MIYKKNSIGDMFCISPQLDKHIQIENNGDVHLYETNEWDNQRFNVFEDLDEKDFRDKFYEIWDKFFGGKDAS